MKLLKRQISSKDGSGMVLVRPEIAEDLWHMYNLLRVDDLVRCTTVRKVMKETSTGSTSSSRKKMMLTVTVSALDFDPDVLQLRISGTVSAENDFVRLGSHHTLTVELHQNVSVEKTCWDQIYLDTLDEAVNPEKQADVAAVVLQTGLAHVCLVSGSLTVTKARIEVNVPKKRTGSSQHAKSVAKFYESIYQSLVRHVDLNKVKCVLIGSPGFLKDDLYQYVQQEAVKRDERSVIENKSKFVLCRASSGHKHALDEMFGDPAIMLQMTETKVAREVTVLNQFMKMIHHDPDRAYYGYDDVKIADEHKAVDSLLVTDELFRNSDVNTRRRYVRLVESVRENGGKVFIFSSMHVSGQQLQQVSGVAAVLRYPLPDLNELELVAAEHEEKQLQQQRGINESNASDDEEYDPEKRVREDLEDMGL